MGYLAYYLVAFGASWALRYPYLLLAAVAVWLCRRWLPDPHLHLKHAAHVRRLKAEIKQNAENVTARRDLAKIWLTKRRPRRAVPLLESARRRDRDSAELAFLLGKALLQAGRAEEALPLLVQAAATNERLMYGEPYLVAGKALSRLGRFAEAEDAFGRYLMINSSSVEGRVLLACVRRELKDRVGAKDATREALQTFAEVPRFRRRAELVWYVRARLMSVGLG